MKRKWLFRALGLFLVGGMCWLLVGITINIPPKSPLQKLNDARALWQSKKPSDYKMTVSFGSFGFIGGFNVEVHGNKVSNVEYAYPNGTFANSSLKLYEVNIGNSLLPEVSDYTMDNMFDFASSKVKDYPVPPSIAWCTFPGIDWRYEAQYDSTYGYMTRLAYTGCNYWQIGGGLMCPQATDCSVNASIRNFEILPSSE